MKFWIWMYIFEAVQQATCTAQTFHSNSQTPWILCYCDFLHKWMHIRKILIVKPLGLLLGWNKDLVSDFGMWRNKHIGPMLSPHRFSNNDEAHSWNAKLWNTSRFLSDKDTLLNRKKVFGLMAQCSSGNGFFDKNITQNFLEHYCIFSARYQDLRGKWDARKINVSRPRRVGGVVPSQHCRMGFRYVQNNYL